MTLTILVTTKAYAEATEMQAAASIAKGVRRRVSTEWMLRCEDFVGGL